jgi:sterol 3beta-glucosyltransferase
MDPLDFMMLTQQTMAPLMDPALSGIRRVCEDADLVLYNLFALPAACFARGLNIPAYPVCQQPLARTNSFPNPVISSRVYVPGVLNRVSHVVAEKCLEYFFWNNSRVNGVPGLNGYFQELYAGKIPMINGFSQVLVPKPRDWGSTFHITGFWFLDPPGPLCQWDPPRDLTAFLDRGDPPVCVGFGSMDDPDSHDIIQIAVASVLQSGRRVVLLSGWSRAENHIKPSPNLYVAKEIPHSWLFSRVSAVIHHGGAGTTAAAVRAGTPSLIIPFFFDQWFWGNRLHSLGAGVKPVQKRWLTVESMASLLDVILDNRVIRKRLYSLSRQVNREDGVGVAVGLIQQLISSQKKDRMLQTA